MGNLRNRDFSTASPASLVVDTIETWAEFRALKPDWQALETRDPQATVFLSWDWMAQAFRANPGRWRVVIVHSADRLICVLPLKYRVHWSSSARAFQSEIEAGGRLLWSEYTGFLCDPTFQAQALSLAAAQLHVVDTDTGSGDVSLHGVTADQGADARLEVDTGSGNVDIVGY